MLVYGGEKVRAYGNNSEVNLVKTYHVVFKRGVVDTYKVVPKE